MYLDDRKNYSSGVNMKHRSLHIQSHVQNGKHVKIMQKSIICMVYLHNYIKPLVLQ